MPATFYLHGNHDRCEACELRREAAARHLAEGGWPAKRLSGERSQRPAEPTGPERH
jgi:hypothetical protein